MSIPSALQAHYDTGNTCMAYGLLLQRKDGTLYGFTSDVVDMFLDVTPWNSQSWDLAGETNFRFDSKQGLRWSTVLTTASLAVSNLDITTLDDGTLFTRDDIRAGKWDSARWRMFRYRWDVSPVTIANDIETLLTGQFGEITLGESTIKIEQRGLAQKMQQTVGIVSQKTCRVRLGSQGVGKCNVDLAPYTHTLTVTAVTDRGQFTCSGATQPDDYFGEGIVTWLTGNNAGVGLKVRNFSGGVFVLVLPAVLNIQVGDTLSAVAGCRKRHEVTLDNPGGVSDCKNKFNNVVNFQGEPHRPTTDELTKPVV